LSKEYKKRREYIEANVEDEEERKAQLAALDEEEDAKKLAIQQEQARRDKALGIFNTVIDTAAAIVRTLRDMGPIAGPIMAGVIGALGVAQTAVIASTPEPFYAGALIQGSPEGIEARIGERNQSEVVLPLERGTEQIADILSERLSGGGEVHNHYHYNTTIQAGTIVADDYSAKQFARKVNAYIIADNQRRGVR
jgi:hypothetical protein